MPFGTPGKILYIDLSQSRTWDEPIPESLYRLYPGGKALAAYLLLKENRPGVDPFAPENTLIFSTGLLCGAPVPTASRFIAVARSPLTGAYGESEAGGFWGPELKFAGYEALVIRGRAERPAYLWISDGHAEICTAEHLWGREPAEVQAQIRAELGDSLVRVLQIGLGGENLVRYAAITNELRHFNGRTGMGAVMGAKNLKAIAVRGHARFGDYASDPVGILKLGKKLSQETKTNPIAWGMHEQGTLSLVDSLNAGGILPTRNFHMGVFDAKDSINWASYAKEIYTGQRSCYACSVKCKREVEAHDRYEVSPEYGGPEYETVVGFGSNCLVGDIQAAAKANELCNRYTLDSISTSATIAFAMECFEAGLIGPEDTGGIELRFGNANAMLQMVELIAHRQGFGNLLAEGSRIAARQIGGMAMDFAIHVKGEEVAMHDPRGKAGVGLGYAICETGADHLVTIHDGSLSKPDSFTFKSASLISSQVVPLPPRELSPQKAANYLVFEKWLSFGKSVGWCFFGPAPRSYLLLPDVLEAVRCASGWEMPVEEMLAIGERATNLARIFNLREGLTPADDTLPPRLFGPLENGPLCGASVSRQEFAGALDALYAYKGWDRQSGIPTLDKQRELGIEWAGELLERG